jgi:glycolate oxidase iron-sulfur subunit
MKDADRCCGSAGIYNIIETEMSMKMLDYKMVQAKDTHATTIVTANPGCLLQMKLGIEKEGLSSKMRGVHIVDLLLEALVE